MMFSFHTLDKIYLDLTNSGTVLVYEGIKNYVLSSIGFFKANKVSKEPYLAVKHNNSVIYALFFGVPVIAEIVIDCTSM